MAHYEMIEHFFSLIQTINRHVRAGQFDQGKHSDFLITRVQWMILRYLRRHPGRTIGQLADHLNVRSSTMSQMIDRLEKVGLAYRSTGTTDARARVVSLTDEGINTIHQIEGRFIEALSAPFDELSPEEQRTLVGLLGKLTGYFPKRGEK
ncbi:MAG TPA: MarR family transcriptional regulator [Selenomonadales bacterium]|nr:MarR family transcriptional regulator [Selenomonadales bacterium]